VGSAWTTIWQTISTELGDAFDVALMTQLLLRLAFAALLGGVVGYDRERRGKDAGLRTHMLVALGAALFVVVPQQAQMQHEALSRVIQGIAAGIGFIGAGAILKLSERGEVRGLTTASGIWLTAALGVAAGYGRIGSALVATMLGMAILTILGWYERDIAPPANEGEDQEQQSEPASDSSSSRAPS
jgi:putative Mg2+ transporter-C (MgtC) family protein